MTARSKAAVEMLADEMRARVLSHPGAWVALRRPVYRDFDPASFSDRDDDRRLPLWQRDPRAIELEYGELRLAFWLAEKPGDVRLIARRFLMLARHLARRALDPERDRAA